MADVLLQATAAVPPAAWLVIAVLIVLLIVAMQSFWVIGPTQVGLVRKRFSWRRLEGGSPVALNGAAGYQADLLTAGLRFKPWPLYTVTRHPMVQIPAGQIGVVIAQVGNPLPIGAKSAAYKPEFGSFQDIRAFMTNGGEKGVQRIVLPPGTVAAIHPVGFLVVSLDTVYGVPVTDEYVRMQRAANQPLTYESFGLTEPQMRVVRIEPHATQDGQLVDMVGIVTTLEGSPSPKGAIANRLGDFTDIAQLEASPATRNSDLVEAILNSKNDTHNNYQDFQAFLDGGGRIGLQHDPLLYGAYNLNPFLVSVEMVPMLVVNQGQVAVVKAYVGLATEDTSGDDFKFGSLVRPGHRGIWEEPLRTGKYAINPRVYAVEIVPTFILTLNWADVTSTAHSLDKDLSPIEAKSMEGFVFQIDLQVQIHVPDCDAPRVISTVGTMANLVNEVLQAAVGNHFRDKLQGMPAIDFIQKRADVQAQAQEHITERLRVYRIETRGVYIQDVVFPAQLVDVLTAREIANQQKATYDAERTAQDQRLLLEASRGRADQQAALAQSMIGVDIARNKAAAVQAAADGEAYRLTKVGEASAVQTRAEGLAVAVGLEAQQQAVGAAQAATINVAKALASGTQRFMPENLAITTGGGGDGIGIGPLLPQLMRWLQSWGNAQGRPRDANGGAGAADEAPPVRPADDQAPPASAMQWAITPSVAPPRIATH
ncbi:MAG TPA: SPFH domain-containing protein [Acetobacteraceae bacterium]|nr:SPFH domain-containing protein [Acetobacteraceae bacterium]